jgi:cytochrome c biogenesis protein ResB
MNALIKTLTSVKFAITLIALIILVAIVGTLLPSGAYIYGSPIFLGLIGLLAVSIASCSLTRLVATWQTIMKSEIEVSNAFIAELPCSSIIKAINLEEVKKQLKSYKIREFSRGESTYLLAQKGRIGRFGAHFAHIGVLFILLGAMVGGIYSYNKIAVITTQQSVTVTGIEIKLNSFEVSYYDNGIPKSYEARVTVIDGNFRQNDSITVNKPLTYKGVSFFLDSFDADGVYRDGKASWVALRVRSDPGVPIVWIGAAVIFTGLVVSFYIPHKRIWIKKSGELILLGGETSKNKLSFSREFERIITNLGGQFTSEGHSRQKSVRL